MVGTELAQLQLERVDPGGEVIHDGEALAEVGLPRLGQRERVEQLAAGDAKEIGHGTRAAERHEGCRDAVLQRRPMAHQVQSEPGPLPLPLSAHLRRRQR